MMSEVQKWRETTDTNNADSLRRSLFAWRCTPLPRITFSRRVLTGVSHMTCPTRANPPWSRFCSWETINSKPATSTTVTVLLQSLIGIALWNIQDGITMSGLTSRLAKRSTVSRSTITCKGGIEGNFIKNWRSSWMRKYMKFKSMKELTYYSKQIRSLQFGKINKNQ